MTNPFQGINVTSGSSTVSATPIVSYQPPRVPTEGMLWEDQSDYVVYRWHNNQWMIVSGPNAGTYTLLKLTQDTSAGTVVYSIPNTEYCDVADNRNPACFNQVLGLTLDTRLKDQYCPIQITGNFPTSVSLGSQQKLFLGYNGELVSSSSKHCPTQGSSGILQSICTYNPAAGSTSAYFSIAVDTPVKRSSTIPDGTTIGTPTITGDGSTGSINLTLSCSGATRFSIYSASGTVTSLSSFSSTPIADSISSTTYTDSGAGAGTTWSYYCIAWGPGGISSASSIITVTAYLAAPNSPTSFVVYGGSTETIFEITPASTGTTPTGYNVYQSTDGTTYTKVVSNASPSVYSGSTNRFINYSFTSTVGTTYYYKISAQNLGGESTQIGPQTVAGGPYTITSSSGRWAFASAPSGSTQHSDDGSPLYFQFLNFAYSGSDGNPAGGITINQASTQFNPNFYASYYSWFSSDIPVGALAVDSFFQTLSYDYKTTSTTMTIDCYLMPFTQYGSHGVAATTWINPATGDGAFHNFSSSQTSTLGAQGDSGSTLWAFYFHIFCTDSTWSLTIDNINLTIGR